MIRASIIAAALILAPAFAQNDPGVPCLIQWDIPPENEHAAISEYELQLSGLVSNSIRVSFADAKKSDRMEITCADIGARDSGNYSVRVKAHAVSGFEDSAFSGWVDFFLERAPVVVRLSVPAGVRVIQ